MILKFLKMPFKIIYFLILLPFKIIKGIFEGFYFIINTIYERFMRLFKFSLSFKITFLYFCISAIILFLVGTSVLLGTKQYLIFCKDKSLNSDLTTIKTYLNNNENIEKDIVKNYISQKNDIFIKKDNEDIFTYKKDLLIKTDISFETRINFGYEKKLTEDIYPYKVLIISNFKDQEFILKSMYILLIIIGSVILLFVLFFSNKISKKMFSPIKDLIDSANEISGKNLDKRVELSNSYDDLNELTSTFNKMLNRIQASYNSQKRFVNDASHELRTPIAVIQGYVNMLDRWGKEDEEILEESIEAIKNESKNMEKLVNNLLFLARIDKKAKTLEEKVFALDKLIKELVKETKMIENDHKIKCDVEDNLCMIADRGLLKQGIRVFLQNSIKYTEKENGEIILKAYSEENDIYIIIKDNGIGIAKRDLPRIFDRFFRADASRTKQTGGVGLGLSIAKWIVNSHGGKIDIKSSLGVGTKVIVKLPYRKEKNDKTESN